MRRARMIAFSVTVAVSALGSAPALAQDTPEQQADRLFKEAFALGAAGRFAEACPKFEQSEKLDPALGTQFDLADCYEHTGRKAEAYKLFVAVALAAKAAGKTERQRRAQQRSAALEPTTARLTIAVPPSAASIHMEVTLDGAPWPPESWNHPDVFDPGPHTIGASAPGRRTFEKSVSLREGTLVELTIPDLESAPPPPPPLVEPPRHEEPQPRVVPEAPGEEGTTRRGAALVVGGIGVLGTLVGAGAGIFSIVKHGQAVDKCSDYNACPQGNGVAEWNAATTAGNVSTVAFIAGGVGLASGLLLWVTAPRGTPSQAWRISPSIGSGLIGVVAEGRL